jgi:hypothetical protein
VKKVDADAADREDSLGTTNEREYARIFLMMKCSSFMGCAVFGRLIGDKPLLLRDALRDSSTNSFHS